jgi:hypothetical protein
MATPAALALEGNDPRDPAHPVVGDNEPVETQLLHNSHDPTVTFEEYIYYATITRAEEKIANERYVAAAGPKSFKSIIKNRFSKGYQEPAMPDSPMTHNSSNGEKTELGEKGDTDVVPTRRNRGGVSDSEWRNASRAVRTAGWSSVFYLITTDILGPFSVP